MVKLKIRISVLKKPFFLNASEKIEKNRFFPEKLCFF